MLVLTHHCSKAPDNWEFEMDDAEEVPRETDALIEGDEVRMELRVRIRSSLLLRQPSNRERGWRFRWNPPFPLVFSLLKILFQLESAVVHETPEGAVNLGSEVEETEVRHRESQIMVLGLLWVRRRASLLYASELFMKLHIFRSDIFWEFFLQMQLGSIDCSDSICDYGWILSNRSLLWLCQFINTLLQ